MSELLSMNLLMAGMMPTMMTLRRYVPSADNPLTPNFWFVMSMALLVGFIVAYPMNWWLVANRLKHGMMTVHPANAGSGMAPHDHAAMSQMSPNVHDNARGSSAAALDRGHDGAVVRRPGRGVCARHAARPSLTASQGLAGERTDAASFFGASRQ
jgi:hypothetical protein